MPYQPVDVLQIEHDGPVAVVTMNNPEIRNAFVDAMHVAMREVWVHLALDRSVRTVVLTGAGKAFSAGGHIPNFILDYDDPLRRRESLRGARRLTRRDGRVPQASGRGCQRRSRRPGLQRRGQL